MTTVPPPRATVEGETTAVLNYIAESVRRLEDGVDRGFAELRRELADLPRQYVPRLELDRRFDELVLDLAEVKAGAAAAETARQQHERDVARERRATRLTLAGLGLTAVSTGGALVFGVLPHLS